MNRFEKIARNIEADLILSDKDKAVIDAFTDGKEADSKKLSTDGKTLDGNWMGGKEIAIRDSEGVITPGEGRPHVKSDEVVLRALKKMTPSRYYRGSERIAAKNITDSFSFSGRVTGEYAHYSYGEADVTKISKLLSDSISRDLQRTLISDTGMKWTVAVDVAVQLGKEKKDAPSGLWDLDRANWTSDYLADFTVTCTWSQVVPEEAELKRRVQMLIAKRLK